MIRLTALMYDEDLDLIYELETIDQEWVKLVEEACNDVFIGWL